MNSEKFRRGSSCLVELGKGYLSWEIYLLFCFFSCLKLLSNVVERTRERKNTFRLRFDNAFIYIMNIYMYILSSRVEYFLLGDFEDSIEFIIRIRSWC